MPDAGGAEIGVETQRLEQRAGLKHRRDGRIARSRRVNRGETLSDGGGEVPLDPAGKQLRLPQPVVGRVKPVHGEEHCLVVMGKYPRRRARHPLRRGLVPELLEAIALDRRKPVLLHRKLRHGALDAEHTVAGRHLPDVRRDAAGQPLGIDPHPLRDDTEANKT